MPPPRPNLAGSAASAAERALPKARRPTRTLAACSAENAQSLAMNDGFFVHSPPAAHPTQFGSLSSNSPAASRATSAWSSLTLEALLSAVPVEPCNSPQSASAAAAAAASVPEHDSAHSEAINVGFFAHSPLAAHPPQLECWSRKSEPAWRLQSEPAWRLQSEGSSSPHSCSPPSAPGPGNPSRPRQTGTRRTCAPRRSSHVEGPFAPIRSCALPVAPAAPAPPFDAPPAGDAPVGRACGRCPPPERARGSGRRRRAPPVWPAKPPPAAPSVAPSPCRPSSSPLRP